MSSHPEGHPPPQFPHGNAGPIYNPSYVGAPVPGVPLGQPLDGTAPPAGQPMPQSHFQAQYQPQYASQMPMQQYPAQIPPAGMPQAPGFFPGPGQYNPSYHPPPQVQVKQHQDPLWYLGVPILDPNTPQAPLGVDKVPGYKPDADFAEIEKATKGWRRSDKEEQALITTITKLDVFKIDALSDFCTAKKGKTLFETLEGKTSGYFSKTLCALALGPLWYDVQLARQSTKGVGTNETLLTELILGRSSPEIRHLITGYRVRYGRNLRDDISSDLSGNAGTLFSMALNAQRPPDSLPVNHGQVTADVETLFKSGQDRVGTKELPFIEVLVNRSQPHLSAVISAYGTKYKSLSKVIKSEFSGHLRNALLYIVHGAKAKRDGKGIWRDAKLLEASMAGMGTKDEQLIYRIVRASWDHKHMEAVKDAYERRYRKPLVNRVRSETSGSYKELLTKLIKSGEQK